MQNDKVYIINFFASWCKSCKKELPLISQVYNETTHNIIAISADKDKTKAKKFVENLKLPFRVIYDTEQEIINSFEPKGFPALYYIKNGKILKSIIGARDNIDIHIKQHIKELK
jgi:thiol-disulfide isomerase/thioredoxin